VRRTIALTVACLFLGTVALAADHQKKPRKEKDGASSVTSISVSWGVRDIEIIREHYAQQYRSLPPGLQKKYERTGQLPPGWQKKMKPLPPSVERECAPLPPGFRRGVIEAHAIIYDSRGTIFDVAALF
jgi:hypothetical protein